MTKDQALSEDELPEAFVEVEGGEVEGSLARERTCFFVAREREVVEGEVEGLAPGLRRNFLPLGDSRITEHIVSGVSVRCCVLI